LEGFLMADFIKRNFMGTTVTLALTGLPVTITGEVVYSPSYHTVTLRMDAGRTLTIRGEMIAFVM
jgi:hypothetical protein